MEVKTAKKCFVITLIISLTVGNLFILIPILRESGGIIFGLILFALIFIYSFYALILIKKGKIK